MSRTVNARPLDPGTGHGIWDYDAHQYYTISRTSVVFGPDAQHLAKIGCYVQIVEVNELTYSSPKNDAEKGGFTTETVLRFNLKDVDPDSVKTAPEDDSSPPGGAFVKFFAADDKPAIHRWQTTWNAQDYFHASPDNLISCTGPAKECTKKEDATVRSDIAVDSMGFARRFAKAFQHAVELCGGKTSAF